MTSSGNDENSDLFPGGHAKLNDKIGIEKTEWEL